MELESVTFGAFLGIAGVFGLTAAAIYPLVRRSYLLWGVARAIFFSCMVIALFPIELSNGEPVAGTNLWLAEAALALGAAMTGPFLANYVEPHIKLGQARRLLYWMLPLGLFAAVASAIGQKLPLYNQLHDLALLACTVLLASGLYSAIKAGSRAARFQLIGWGPLVLIGLVAFSYELVTQGHLPYWPYLLLAGLVIDFVVSATGIVDGFVIIQKERDRAMADMKAAELMTVTDPLTEIANRRGLDQHFENADRSNLSGLALIDCDHFKRINDQFGHETGDRVLVGIAQGLKIDNTFVARLGGEEFVVLIYGDDWQERAEQARRCITLAVRAYVPDLPYPVTASAGLTSISEGDTLTCAMKRADKALYAAKESGRNRSLSLTEFRPPSEIGEVA
ncbi:GGDEF domain-containing protein [Qipengyuania aquimaris]|uniref:GGDEF domain-containing protein n=1 Tax=Qipengyuania aquimaris TaxID=255984 RepID=UPI001C95E0EB|nr:GGDEF domain-containing protein [Qipengyuania aquimaris]MBY6128023.1 GGDEF domain-containing protein [Qipengyuania aquimaris]